jgi:radical SAM superfamily enzyme YgiQ (UPF0313 family)
MISTKMKVLLVLPAGDQYRIATEKDNVPSRNMLRFSILSLTLVAALTPPEYKVDICDENVEVLDFETDAQVIGISFMTALAPRAFEIASRFREKGKTVVAGGYHPTLCPNETAKYFNAVVIGDAEELWPKVLNDIANNSLQSVYQHSSLCSLTQTPFPRRDLLHNTANYYATTNAVQIGRGCIHACKFCSISAFYSGKYRSRPLSNVIGELKSLSKDLIFVDDNIISNPEYARDLFKEMIPLKKRWVGQCSLKIADDTELLQLAYASGCQGLFIGIETLNKENLSFVGKDINTEYELKKRINTIRKAKIAIIAGLIVGMDFDDISVFEYTLQFLKQTKIDAIQVNIMTPLPGTPLFEKFKISGRITDTDYSNYDFRHVVIKPARMTPGELQNGADWLYNSFYRLDKIILRTLGAMWRLGILKALLGFKLNMTYRYDNKRENIVGYNPFKKKKSTDSLQLINKLQPLQKKGFRTVYTL